MLAANEAYQLLFSDSLTASLIYPFTTELIFGVMLSFGGYNIWETAAIAFAGNTFGSVINYSVGKLVYNSRGKAKLKKADEDKFQKIVSVVNEYGIYALLLSWHYMFGSLVTLFAGIFNVRLKIFLSLVLAGNLGYYLFYLSNESLL